METKKKKKRWVGILLGVAVLLAVMGVLRFLGAAARNSEKVVYTSYTVVTGSITSTVTGSGKLESWDKEEMEIPAGLEIASVPAKEGDRVAEGDVLATLETDSLADRAAALLEELSTLDAALLRLNASKTTEYVYAPASGRIKYMPVLKGSDVIENIKEFGSLALLSTDGLMQVEIQTEEILPIFLNVTVKWQDGQDTGRVLKKTSEGYLVTLDDDKAPYLAKAEVYSGETLLGEGGIGIHAPVAIYAGGGKVSKVHYSLGDKVTSGAKLFTLEEGAFSPAYQQKYSERTEVAEQLEQVLAYQADPCIRASKAGVLGEVNVVGGDVTGSALSGGTGAAFVIHTGGAIKMEVLVDELDIHSVSLGQKADITLDAVASEKFEGAVSRISGLGDSAKSIATFRVELTLSPDERFFEGMNGSATILVDEAKGVLVIPVAAISEDSSGPFVYLGTDLLKTYIETGLSDGENVEVTKGLQAGDVIQYVVLSNDSAFDGFQGPFMRSGMDEEGSASDDEE